MVYVIEASNLSKTFRSAGKTIKALDDVSLEVEKGEIFIINRFRVSHLRLAVSNMLLILNCLINDAWINRIRKPVTGNRKLRTGTRTQDTGPETTGESQLWRRKKKNAEW